ncbi:MAG: ribonuclease E/G [Eubacterium sp.]|nr:ribonuclease E/G [Eubacterium sp.]
MEAKYIITNYKEKEYGFLFEDNKLVSLCPVSENSELESIFTAKVVNIVPSINAAFLNVGLDDYYFYSLNENKDKNIFLHHGASNKVCNGDELLVQIERAPFKNKKGIASSNLSLKGDYVILNMTGQVGISKKITDPDERERLKKEAELTIQTYNQNNKLGIRPGAIIRTAAQDIGEGLIGEELKNLLSQIEDIISHAKNLVPGSKVYGHSPIYIEEIRENILKKSYANLKVITDIPRIYNVLKLIFPAGNYPGLVELVKVGEISLDRIYDIKTKLEKSFSKYINLKSGGNIVVEPTEALTVIDVNTAKAIDGKNTEATFLKINKEAASEIARVLRLRNLSGIIVIDFINMKEESSIHTLIEHLKNEIIKDEVKVTYVDMTPLGLVELTRKKLAGPIELKDL